jgi:hypothetical protein
MKLTRKELSILIYSLECRINELKFYNHRDGYHPQRQADLDENLSLYFFLRKNFMQRYTKYGPEKE